MIKQDGDREEVFVTVSYSYNSGRFNSVKSVLSTVKEFNVCGR